MKKWLITYLFIVCAICLHADGFASPAQTICANKSSSGYITSLRTFTFKKALPSYDHPGKKDADIFFHQHSIRILNTVVSSYITETNFFLSISCHVPEG